MTKPKQPLQAMRRGFKAMSDSSPMRGIRSLSPAARKGHAELQDTNKQKTSRHGRTSSGNQNFKPVPIIKDEVIGRISPEKMRKEKQQKQQQRQEQSHSHRRGYDSRDEQRDHAGSSRGRADRGSRREQPSPPGRRKGGWDPKLEMPRGTVMDHLVEFPLEPPPPPPPMAKKSSSPRRKSSNKKESRRQSSSSPGRRQSLQDQFEFQKGKSQHHIQQLKIEPSATSGSRSTFSRSQLIENPQFASSGSSTFLDHHQKHPPPPPPVTTTPKSSPRSPKASPWESRPSSKGRKHRSEERQPTTLVVQNGTFASSSEAGWPVRGDPWGATLESSQSIDSFTAANEWVASFDAAEEKDLWKFDSRLNSKSKQRSPRRQRQIIVSEPTESFLSESRDQDVLDSRHEKFSSSFTNSSSGLRVPPPAEGVKSALKSGKVDKEKKSRGNGFLNFFGGAPEEEEDKNHPSKNARKGKANLASEMLEIGSEATVTAGDLMVEESFGSTLLSVQQSDSRTFLHDDHGARQFRTPPTMPRSPRKHDTKNGRSRSPPKAKNLTGDYLHNKLMHLDSSSHLAREDTDDHSLVSNLTDPTVFKNSQATESRQTPQVNPSPKQSMSAHSTVESKRASIGRAPSASHSDRMSGPESSWDMSAAPNVNTALGRALDTQFMSQTPTTAPDVLSPTHRPPLLPKSTMGSATDVSADRGQPEVSSSLPSRRGKGRSRTPSPSPIQKTAPPPATKGSRTPLLGAQLSEAKTTQPLRNASPFRRRMESNSKPRAAGDWSKQKDSLIEERLAQTKTQAEPNQPLVKSCSRSTSASRGLSLRKNARAASSSPARKQANVGESPRTTSIMARARAQSASRAQPTTRQEAPLHRPDTHRDPSPSPKTTLLGRAQSTGKVTQKMESLSKVMSRVPSSLGSRGGASDSIELKRKESAKSLLSAKLTAPSAPSREVDSIEQRRRSSAAGLRQASPARNSTASLQKQAPTQSQGSRSIVVSQKQEQVSYHSSSHSKRRSKTKEPATIQPTTNKAYLPTNAYSGRFTPKIKKSNDKVTEIRASREQDNDIVSTHSSVNPRSPKRKQVPRDVGAQKLRNMIKLRNHFDSSASTSTPGFAHATSASLQKSRQSSKNTRVIEKAPNAQGRNSSGPTKGRNPSGPTKGRGSGGPVSNRKATPLSRTAGNQSRPNDRMTMIRETGLIDSFSVAGSDLRSLRSAIQSRTSYSSDRLALSHRGVNLDRYDESKIDDPMQRAGLRLLSAAVVPIQAAARRFLARREALSMLWAALVVQARVRAFLEQTRYEIKVYSAIRIQASARGMLVRDRLMFEDYCATEIQRYVRGRIAMVRVYDTIYKISLVQSQVRMRLAIRNATIRMYCVLKIQGAARGFLVRCRLAYAHRKATDIQRFVRGYLASMRVFDEVYKITLIQNLARKKQALDRATMRMALILSIQALARGYLVRCRLDLAHYHATTIQRYTRGYLGTMRVYEEIYKIMLLQNFFRMKIAVNLATKRMTMIIQLQANWRRYCVMRRMEYAHYNATVIQRYTRGYLATLSVYEEIYKITLIQNFVRMKNAMALASSRRNFIVRTQAIVRGFILRGRLDKICEKAVTIQTAWRTFYYRLVYQFKLLDIIILQNVWRRKKAIRIANEKRYALQNLAATIIQTRWRCYDARETYLQYKIEDRAATVIQTQWRCYDTSMDYLHYLADVLIVQSMARRWFAMREVTAILVKKSIVLQRVARGYLGRVEAKKQRSAVAIQKTWRGFVAFADYMFKIADIVIVQTVARRWFACRRANYLRHKIEHDAATVIQRWRRGILERRVQAAITIQKVWRGLVQEADFAITLYEYRAARTIQTYWRRFWKFSNYLICLDCSIRIQAVVRGFLARCRYADEQWGAVILQAAARGILGRRKGKSKKMVIGQKLNSNAIGSLESMAATVVQSAIRGYFGRGAHMRYRSAQKIQAMVRGYQGRTMGQRHAAARVIQSMWRCILAQEFYIQSVSAIRIQKHWRGMIYAAAYQRFMAARRIQNCWRISQAKEVVLCRKAERVAAIAIQSAWRGYFYYTNYLFCLCDVAKVQCAIRCYLARKKLKELRIQRANKAAVAIQKAWRGFYSYTCFLITLSEIIRIQCLARKFLERRRFMGFHASIIQSAWRGYSCYVGYTYTLADIIRIQSQMRRALAKRRLDNMRNEKEHASAIIIQNAWRRYFCRSNYLFILSDVIKVQTEVRRFLAQKLFFEMWEQHAIKSAVKIQTRWRCYFACTNYMFVREDAIKIQATARGFLARNRFLELFGEKCQASAISIQTTWRRSKAQKNYREILFKVCLIQQRIRYFFAMREIREEAAIFIQKAFRSFVYRSSYVSVRTDVILAQSICRRAVAIKEYRQLCHERALRAAVRIQALVRGSRKRGTYVANRKAILDIQRYWRGYNDRIGLFVAWKQHIYRIHHAALQFQKLWRGYVINQRYLYILGSAIEIQSLGRMILAKAYVRRQHQAATKIQTLWRRASARHVSLLLCSQKNYINSRQHAVFMSRSVTKIQRAWRCMIRRRVEVKSAKIIGWFGKIAIAKAEIRRRAAAKRIYSFFLLARSKQQTPERLLHQRKLQSVSTIQAWYPAAKRLREQRRRKAALTIFRFFKMVKAEVDREIELELKRRKQRKEQRKRHHINDDKILETAWEKTSRVGIDQPRRRRVDREKVIQDTLNELQNRSRCTAYAGGSPMHKFQKGAPPMLALADALEDQSVAQSSIASNAFNRPSPSRVESFSQREFDEDYCLEEAFLDAEINTAKSRRKTEKRKVKTSRRNKVSSNASVTSRASVSSRVSVGSRMSVSSRFSTGTKESRDNARASRSDTETKKVNRHLYKRLDDSPRQSSRKR